MGEHTVHLSLQIAWSVARTSNQAGPTNLVTYDTVLVNEGDPFDPSTNAVTIRTTGYYLVHLSVGLLPGHGTWYGLNLNGTRQHYIVRNSPMYTNGIDTIGRTMVKYYEAGDVLTMSNHKGAPSTMYSDERMQTAFCGLLIYTV